MRAQQYDYTKIAHGEFLVTPVSDRLTESFFIYPSGHSKHPRIFRVTRQRNMNWVREVTPNAAAEHCLSDHMARALFTNKYQRPRFKQLTNTTDNQQTGGVLKLEFPTMTSSCGQFITTKGNFYQQIDCGIFQQIQTFLPGSPTTYGFKTQEDVARWLFTKLSTGNLKIRRGGGLYTFDGERVKTIKKAVPRLESPIAA